MSEPTTQPVSVLLARWQAGDEESLRHLMPLVYNELRHLAHRDLRNERPDHTLESKARSTVRVLRGEDTEPDLWRNE